MGVTIRKKNGSWYVFVNHKGQRKAKCVGDSRAAAVEVKRMLEAKLVLGDIGVFSQADSGMPNFGSYADLWMKDYARMECKSSTADGYEGVLRQYLRPKFAPKHLDEIKRNDIKALISELISKGLARSTVRNALSVLRGIFNQAAPASGSWLSISITKSSPSIRLNRSSNPRPKFLSLLSV